MGGAEQSFVNQAFETNWIAPLGPLVNGFETDLQNFTKAKHAAALSSGTAALHLGLILHDVKAGDYVICQSMTFSASANPIAYLGAIPVFVDSEQDTWNMCPDALEDALRSLAARNIKPKVIIPVHLYGMPAQMNRLLEIANQYEIPVLEDAAEALGSTYQGQACGTFGQAGVLSFNGNKIITTSGGGALISDDANLIDKARFLATQARDQAPHYQHSHIGYNYRLSNVLAGIGRGQMEVLADRVAARRANFERYKNYFHGFDGIEVTKEPSTDYFSNRWLTTILVKPAIAGITRETLRLALDSENIEARPLWKPMHMQPVFKDCLYFGNQVCEKLFDEGLCLPSGSNLSEKDFDRIFETINSLQQIA